MKEWLTADRRERVVVTAAVAVQVLRRVAQLLGAGLLVVVLLLEALGDPALLEAVRRLCGS